MRQLQPRAPEGENFEHWTATRELINGRSNAVGSVTLTANVATTTVTKETIAAGAAVFTEPTTANASAEKAAGTMWISAVAAGSFTITHANNAQTDRTFFYLVNGG